MEGLFLTVPILVRPEIRAKIEALIQEIEDGKKNLNPPLKRVRPWSGRCTPSLKQIKRVDFKYSRHDQR